MDAQCTPQGIGYADFADDLPGFPGNPWPVRSSSRLPSPERLEAAFVPSHDNIRLDDDH
jgi:hypothetical protein